jgi:hypothetical protein
MTITLTREEAQQVLDALDEVFDHNYWQSYETAVYLLRARLAQPEPEPVAWADKYDIDREGHDFHVSRQQPAKDGAPLYTAPPQREWHGLTDKEMEYLYEQHHNQYGECESVWYGYERAIEAKLKEKNT